MVCRSNRWFEANDEWRAIQYEAATLAKGSGLDFSGDLDAPAGKHEEAVLREDGANKALHLYGVVISHTLPFQNKGGS